MKKVRSEAGQTTMTTAGPKSIAHKGLRGQEAILILTKKENHEPENVFCYSASQ